MKRLTCSQAIRNIDLESSEDETLACIRENIEPKSHEGFRSSTTTSRMVQQMINAVESKTCTICL